MKKVIDANILYSAINDRWEKYNSNSKCKPKAYYFDDYTKNLISAMSDNVIKMYKKGAGNEFGGKMCALHSSSAMTFNIFGNGNKNGKIKLLNKISSIADDEYWLEYEKKLPALYSAANLDVCLSSDENVFLFEMKMTEWLLNNPSPISESYLNEKRYPNELFKPLSNLICKYKTREIDRKGRKYYYPKTNHFDVFQIIKHIFGIYKGIEKKKLEVKPTANVTLIVGFWTVPDNDFFGSDKGLYNTYKKIEQSMKNDMDEFCDSLIDIKALFNNALNVKFNMKYLTVKEIIECLGKSNEPYLKRYI